MVDIPSTGSFSRPQKWRSMTRTERAEYVFVTWMLVAFLANGAVMLVGIVVGLIWFVWKLIRVFG